MNSPIKLDPEQVRIPDDVWEFEELTEDFVVHKAAVTLPNGNVGTVYRKKPRQLTAMLEDNRRLLNESDGKRFGDGRIVGRVPMNVLFENVERLRDGDTDWLKWFLNHSDNRMYRTFRGKV